MKEKCIYVVATVLSGNTWLQFPVSAARVQYNLHHRDAEGRWVRDLNHFSCHKKTKHAKKKREKITAYSAEVKQTSRCTSSADSHFPPSPYFPSVLPGVEWGSVQLMQVSLQRQAECWQCRGAEECRKPCISKVSSFYELRSVVLSFTRIQFLIIQKTVASQRQGNVLKS